MRNSRRKTRKVIPKSEEVQASGDELRISLSIDQLLGEGGAKSRTLACRYQEETFA